jgi:hypothetical protein
VSEARQKAIDAIIAAGQAMLRALEMNLPPGRELSLAKTRVEEAVMWAVKGVAA